jgi:polar amino acid transport system substrate-binding protein
VKRHFLFLLLLITGTVYSAHAQEITIVTEDYPPYHYAKNGIVVGQGTETVQAVLDLLGIQAPIEIYPWARAYYMALNNKNTLIYGIARTPQRENLFKWIGVSSPVRYCLFALASRKDIQVGTLEDAKRYKIGTVRDDIIEQYLMHKGFQIREQIEPNSSYEANLKKMISRRIDLWGVVDLTAHYLVQSDQYPKNIIKEVYCLTELSTEGAYMAFSKTTPDALVDQFREALKKIKEDGTYDKVLSKYLQ